MKKNCIAGLLAGLFISFGMSVYGQNYDSLCSNYKTYYSLEEALKEPLKVYKLDLSLLKLTSISPDIAKLENLVCLDLGFNRFATLPPEFSKLRHLEYLNLIGTRYMAKLPTVLASISSLKVVDLREHPEWTAAKYAEAQQIIPKATIIK
jgi:Leucine-rich repeat (LRR) protein